MFPKDRTRALFNQAIEKHLKSLQSKEGVRILEVGGIDRPFLQKSSAYEYCGLDIEVREKCYEVYDSFIVKSIEEELDGEFDLILSRMVLEHVPDNHKAWDSIYNSLKPGGYSVHVFPSGLHPFSLATRIVGSRLQRNLIPMLRPDARHTGYPAYYNLCSPKALQHHLPKKGFCEVSVKTSYAASDYFAFFVPLFVMIGLFNTAMEKFKIQTFCSNVFVVARKPQKLTAGNI